VTASLEVEDASPVSTTLATLQAWADRLVEKERERLEARKARALAQYGRIPAWIERGMGRRAKRAEQVRLRVQMLLGICSAKGVLPLEHKPAHSVGDLLLQHLDDLEQEADDKGGVQAVLRAHFARMFKVAAPTNLFAGSGRVA